jgi:hypothetical protein
MKIKKSLLFVIIIVILAIIGLIVWYTLQTEEPTMTVNSPIVPSTKSVEVNAGISLTNPSGNSISLYLINYDEIEANLGRLTTFFDEDFNLESDEELFSVYKSASGISILFDKVSAVASFSLETPMSLGFDQFTPNEESSNVFINILKEIKGGNSYRLVDYSSLGGAYELEYSLVLDNILIEMGPTQAYSDMFKLDSNDNLVSGKINLASYTKDVSVSLLSTTQVGNLLDRSQAIYEFTELAVPDYSNAISGSSAIPYDNTEANITTPVVYQTDSCVAQKMTLIYLYKQWDQNYLLPTYKIDCLGSDTVDEKVVEVPVIVYTSAIDSKYLSQ